MHYGRVSDILEATMKKTIANLLPLIAAAAVMSAGARSPESVPDVLALPNGGRAATAAQWEKDVKPAV